MNHPRLCLVLLCLALVLAGCGPRTVISSSPPRAGQASRPLPDMTTSQLLREADGAYTAGRLDRSFGYYEKLVLRPDLPPTAKGQVLERYAASALAVNDPRAARDGLSRWVAYDAKARETFAWQEMDARTLILAGDGQGGASGAVQVLSMGGVAWAERSTAGMRAAEALVARGHQPQALRVYDALYAKAPSARDQVVVQRRVTELVAQADDASLERMAAGVTAANQGRTPYAEVRQEVARRASGQSGIRELPVDGGTTSQPPATAPSTAQAGGGQTFADSRGGGRLGVALVLPTSGKFADVAWRIMAGAKAAQAQLAAMGTELDVRLINADTPSWLGDVDALPPQFGLVGGPLQTDTLRLAHDAGATRRRAFMAFVPGLPPDIVEGRDAWRFFGSSEDQVRALVGFTTQELAIRRFGVVHPEERYGQHMAELFTREANARGGMVAGQAGYAPKDPAQWTRAVAKALHTPARPAKDAKPLEPPFEAAFLPDGWSQAQLLAPQFQYQGAEGVILMGPELWSQSLAKANAIDTTSFPVALCPGAFAARGGSPALSELRSQLQTANEGVPDFWSALGFDFVRLAARLGPVQAGTAPEELGGRLALAADGLTYSLAPLRYDVSGRATMDMFVFSVTREGLILANPILLRQRLDELNATRQQRLEAWKARQQQPPKAP